MPPAVLRTRVRNASTLDMGCRNCSRLTRLSAAEVRNPRSPHHRRRVSSCLRGQSNPDGLPVASRGTASCICSTDAGDRNHAGDTAGAVSIISSNFSHLKLTTTDPYYLYTRVQCDSATASLVVVRLEYEAWSDAGVTSIASDTAYYGLGFNYNLGTVPIDSSWHLLRLGPITASLATLAQLDLRIKIIKVSGTPAAVLNFDDTFFGRALDFQDLYQYQAIDATTQSGTGKGAYCISPMKVNTSVPRTVVQADNGAVEAYQWASGRKSIDFKSSIIDNTSVSLVRNFYDYTSDKTSVTFSRDQTSITRDYIGKAIVTNPDDGIDQDKGSPDFQFGWSLKEVI